MQYVCVLFEIVHCYNPNTLKIEVIFIIFLKFCYSSGEQGTVNPNQVASTCKLQQKENESHNRCTTELFKQDTTPKELVEVKKLNKNAKQNNTSTSQTQSHKETNAKKQRMSHTTETAISGWYNFSDPIKKVCYHNKVKCTMCTRALQFLLQ